MKMSKEDVKVKMSSGERNPLTVNISQGHVEEGDAKVELQETHFKSQKVLSPSPFPPPPVSTLQRSQVIKGPNVSH